MAARKTPFGGVPFVASLPVTSGRYFFVNSVGGSNVNGGLKPEAPLATVNGAFALCTANAGDIIVCLPGHAETVTATSIAHSVAGVRVIGLGIGALRPTFTYGAAAATITISAANGSWENCRFIANFLNVAAAFTLSTAKNTTICDNDFLDTSSILNFLSCVVTGATNNDADGLAVLRNYVYGLATTDGAVISMLGNALRVNLSYNIVDKAATNDAGHFVTLSSKVMGGIRILSNMVTVVGSSGAAVGIFLTGSGTTSSGIMADNYVWSLDTTTALIMTASTGIRPIQNFLSGAVDASGTLYPAADNPA